MAITIGMQKSENMEEAKSACETCMSLRDETACTGQRVRRVQTSQAHSDEEVVTESRLRMFREELKTDVNKKFTELPDLMKQSMTTGNKQENKQNAP